MGGQVIRRSCGLSLIIFINVSKKNLSCHGPFHDTISSQGVVPDCSFLFGVDDYVVYYFAIEKCSGCHGPFHDTFPNQGMVPDCSFLFGVDDSVVYIISLRHRDARCTPKIKRAGLHKSDESGEWSSVLTDKTPSKFHKKLESPPGLYQ